MADETSARRDHWDRVHRQREPAERSWFQPSPALSLELIANAGAAPAARVIDVGGGASRLVDHLLAAGYEDVTVLDIAPAALAESRRRLGERAQRVRWIEADVTSGELGGTFDVWHDRAVFHFLVDPEDRRRYLSLLALSVPPGGHAVIATFAEDGPDKCSGLPIVRYGKDTLARTLGSGWERVDWRRELHTTPAGKEQSFVYCLFRRAE